MLTTDRLHTCFAGLFTAAAVALSTAAMQAADSPVVPALAGAWKAQ